jgi:dihydroorotase
MESTQFDLILRGGRVIDPARGIDGVMDVGVRGGKITAVGPGLGKGTRSRAISVKDHLVLPGLIDTHAHVYEHVTGPFGLNADMVGIQSGVTAVVDQGGASALTFGGFRKFVIEPSVTRVYSFISCYLAGGLYGHRHTGLYGPHGMDVNATVRAIEDNRDAVRGIKTHAEPGGYSRWGIDVLRLAKEQSRRARVPVYVHLGRLWPEAEGERCDPDAILRDVLPLLDPGDILAHPFTKHPGAFVSSTGEVHPLVREAHAKGVRFDVGHGSHFSARNARIVLDAGIVPFTLGADLHGYALKKPNDGHWSTGTFVAEHQPTARILEGGARGGGAAAFNLHHAMSELLALGVPLVDVVKMVTCNAAEILGLAGELGTLAPGTTADVSVVRLERGDWTVRDAAGEELTIPERIRPVFALRNGHVYRSDSPFLSDLLTAAA